MSPTVEFPWQLAHSTQALRVLLGTRGRTSRPALGITAAVLLAGSAAPSAMPLHVDLSNGEGGHTARFLSLAATPGFHFIVTARRAQFDETMAASSSYEAPAVYAYSAGESRSARPRYDEDWASWQSSQTQGLGWSQNVPATTLADTSAHGEGIGTGNDGASTTGGKSSKEGSGPASMAASVVPEPATLGLFGLGLVGLGLALRRRRG